jgi:hypothetical protein
MAVAQLPPVNLLRRRKRSPAEGMAAMTLPWSVVGMSMARPRSTVGHKGGRTCLVLGVDAPAESSPGVFGPGKQGVKVCCRQTAFSKIQAADPKPEPLVKVLDKVQAARLAMGVKVRGGTARTRPDEAELAVAEVQAAKGGRRGWCGW